MRKTELSSNDLEICRRLRQARERLDLSQEGCARQIGIERSTLLNYEHCRTPLRFEIGLRFCRQFIISEEWLATGRYAACHAEAQARGIAPGAGMERMNSGVFFRQCLDLLSEPASLHIPQGISFGDAYDKFLAPEYKRLIHEFFYFPRIALSDSDNPELACHLLDAINKRFILLLNNEAVRRNLKHSSAWRVYARCLLECSDLVFRKMMRFASQTALSDRLNWLKQSVTEPNYFIPFMGEESSDSESLGLKNDLTSSSLKSNTSDVKAEIQKLINRVKLQASQPGEKAKLARALEVAPARISEWLAGEKEPGGEYTLQLLQWVEQQERK